jgi:hypothetical protein
MSRVPFQEVVRGSRPRGGHRIGQAGSTAAGSQLGSGLTGGVNHSPAFFQREFPQSPELQFVGVLLRLGHAIDGS